MVCVFLMLFSDECVILKQLLFMPMHPLRPGTQLLSAHFEEGPELISFPDRDDGGAVDHLFPRAPRVAAHPFPEMDRSLTLHVSKLKSAESDPLKNSPL